MIGKASEKVAREEGADRAMVEARGVEKEYAAGGVRVHALRGGRRLRTASSAKTTAGRANFYPPIYVSVDVPAPVPRYHRRRGTVMWRTVTWPRLTKDNDDSYEGK